MQFPQGEMEARNTADKMDKGSKAFDAIVVDTNNAAAKVAVEGTANAAQTEDKIDAVKDLEDTLLSEEPVNQDVVDSLGAGISAEKGQLESETGALEEDKIKVDTLKKTPGGDETKMELQEILDEGVANAEV